MLHPMEIQEVLILGHLEIPEHLVRLLLLWD